MILFVGFDRMYSDKFCGSKAIDFCKNLSSKVCVVMNSNELDSALVGYDQIFRRYLKINQRESNEEDTKKKVHLTFVIDNTASANNVSEDEAEIVEQIKSSMQRILSETKKQEV